MADQSTFERVCAIVREQGGLDDVELTAETTLAEVGLVEIDAESNPTTIGEFVEMVDSLLEN